MDFLRKSTRESSWTLTRSEFEEMMTYPGVMRLTVRNSIGMTINLSSEDLERLWDRGKDSVAFNSVPVRVMFFDHPKYRAEVERRAAAFRLQSQIKERIYTKENREFLKRMGFAVA